MQSSIADRTRLVRDDAWQLVVESEAFIAFKALDDAYVRMGGASRLADEPNALAALTRQTFSAVVKRVAEARRVSHAEAAEMALRKAGRPLETPILMAFAKEVGADVGGSDPLNNFRSSVSREGKFRSVRKDGTSYWWFKDEALPSGWNEPADPSLLDEPAGSSVYSSQEGGDGDAPATT